MRIFKLSLAVLGVVTMTGVVTSWAEGNDTLGTPGIPIQSGTGVLAAGTGLYEQPGTIQLSVPAEAKVKQVLLYWGGAHHVSLPADNTIIVNGVTITGTAIGSGAPTPTEVHPELGDIQYVSFRADITDKNLVKPGENTLSVSGLENSFANDGAGVLVIIENGGSVPAHLDIRDGLDWAYWKSTTGEKFTNPQTFSFPAAPQERTGELLLFVESVDQNRPNQIKLTVNGQTTTLTDPLFSNNGDQWDTFKLEVTIPAQATSVTVELISTPVDNPLGGGASLGWIMAAFSVANPQPAPPGPCLGTRTQGFWKNHPAAWPNDSIVLGGETLTKAEAIAVMQQPAAKDKTFNLAEQLIAAKLNVAVGNDSECVSEAIADADAFLEEHPIGSSVGASSPAWKTVASAFATLGDYNEGKLCASHAECEDGDQAPEPGKQKGFTKCEKRGKKLNLVWQGGQLECADDLKGPWVPVPEAASSAEMPFNGSKKFYRIQR